MSQNENKPETAGLGRDLLRCLLAGLCAAAVIGGVGALIGLAAYGAMELPYPAPGYGAVVALLLAGALVMLVSVFTTVRQARRTRKRKAASRKEKPSAGHWGLLRLPPQTALLSVGALLVLLGFGLDLLLRAL